MFNWLSILVLFIVTGSALILALWPFRQHRVVWLLALGLCCAVGAGYGYWGSWEGQTTFVHKKIREQAAEKLLHTLKSPQVLVKKLEQHLQTHPRSARGWYLLGRLYASQQMWDKAHQAFVTAYGLKPEDELIAVNYAQSLFAQQSSQDAKTARDVLKHLLESHPQNPDALMLLALDAQRRHANKEALVYWRKLLLLVPDDSPEAGEIRKAIEKLSLGL